MSETKLEVCLVFLLTQEMMKKDEGSKQDQSSIYERSASPSFPRLSSPNTPVVHPVAPFTSAPSPRKQPQTHQVPQHTLELKFPVTTVDPSKDTTNTHTTTNVFPPSDGEF